MTATLTALGLTGALMMALAGAPAMAAKTDAGDGDKRGHGDRITWPCPGTPST